MSGRLRRELKQTRGFSSLAEEVMLNLQRTADWLSRSTAELLKPHGVSATQYNVLRILRGAGPGGLPSSEIGGRMITRDPDITRLLDRLERSGLVRRRRERRDRRVVTAHITPQGLELLAGLDRPVEVFHRRALRHVSKAKLKLLNELLEEARKL
jgi:DNA-binding MarR family transcriptional regulator